MAPRDSITVEEFDIERPHSDVHEFYRNFCRAIDGTEEQLVTHEQLIHVMKIMEASFASAKENGAPVSVE